MRKIWGRQACPEVCLDVNLALGRNGSLPSAPPIKVRVRVRVSGIESKRRGSTSTSPVNNSFDAVASPHGQDEALGQAVASRGTRDTALHLRVVLKSVLEVESHIKGGERTSATSEVSTRIKSPAGSLPLMSDSVEISTTRMPCWTECQGK